MIYEVPVGIDGKEQLVNWMPSVVKNQEELKAWWKEQKELKVFGEFIRRVVNSSIGSTHNHPIYGKAYVYPVEIDLCSFETCPTYINVGHGLEDHELKYGYVYGPDCGISIIHHAGFTP